MPADDAGIPATAVGHGQSPAVLLIDLVTNEDLVELFHDPAERCYATYKRSGHQETTDVSSPRFRRHCEEIYYRATSKAISNNAFAEAKGIIAAKAAFDGPELSTAVRCARESDIVYIDIGDEGYNVAAVSATGYSLITSAQCPVRFVRRPGMQALPNPVEGGTLELLDRYLPTDHHGRVLFKAHLVASLYTGIPASVLSLTGPQGSGKSTIARRFRALVDPNRSPLRSEPRDSRDIAAAVHNNYVCVFDNVSVVPPWLSDAICRLATGGGSANRTLYTNDEEHVVDAIRPVVITAIENVVLRGDLADRTINVGLQLIDESTRLTEAELDAQFEADRPAIFGALLNALSLALRFKGKINRANLGRMADFEVLGRAAATAFGVTAEVFADICRTARIATSSDVAEASPLTEKLDKIAAAGWSGSFSELFKEIVK